MEIRQHILNNTWVRKEISREILRYFELNKNENTTQQNLQNAVKAVLGGKFIASYAYISKERKA